MGSKKRKAPVRNRQVFARSERREIPDLRELSRALIALALTQAQAEADAQAQHQEKTKENPERAA
jgi:hypothetical protein